MSGGLSGEEQERYAACPDCRGKGWRWGRDDESAPVQDLGEFTEKYCECPAGAVLRERDQATS